jgi:hypothetical protein
MDKDDALEDARDDDISRLFSRFGGDPKSYRPLGSSTAAHEARGRWALLSGSDHVTSIPDGPIDPVAAGAALAPPAQPPAPVVAPAQPPAPVAAPDDKTVLIAPRPKSFSRNVPPAFLVPVAPPPKAEDFPAVTQAQELVASVIGDDVPVLDVPGAAAPPPPRHVAQAVAPFAARNVESARMTVAPTAARNVEPARMTVAPTAAQNVQPASRTATPSAPRSGKPATMNIASATMQDSSAAPSHSPRAGAPGAPTPAGSRPVADPFRRLVSAHSKAGTPDESPSNLFARLRSS